MPSSDKLFPSCASSEYAAVFVLLTPLLGLEPPYTLFPADYMAYYSFDGNYENGGSKSNVTTENVGVTKISNYSGNKVYGVGFGVGFAASVCLSPSAERASG